MQLKFAKKADLKCSHYSHSTNATMSGDGYINYLDCGVDFTMYMCIKSSCCTPFKNHIVQHIVLHVYSFYFPITPQ